MKNIKYTIFIILCFLALTGCGSKDSGTVEYTDIHAEAEQVFDGFRWEGDGECRFLGMQFYQDEPVQLWGICKWEDGKYDAKVYLYRKDGTCELLVENLESADMYCGWYIDREGGCYCKVVDYDKSDTFVRDMLGIHIVKYDPLGNELYSSQIGGAYLGSFCPMPDGRIYLFLREIGGNVALAELDAAGGGITEVEYDFGISSNMSCYMGTGEEGLFLCDESLMDLEWLEFNPAEKSLVPVLSCQGTSYAPGAGGIDVSGMQLYDFRVLGDGGIEILWGDRKGSGGVLEKLQTVRVEKTPVVMRGLFYNDPWLKNYAAQFNQMNDDYYIVLEECRTDLDGGTATLRDTWADYARRTSVEMASGKGPDILYGGVLRDYLGGILEKGGLVDLAPYMEESGIKEEDYFPFAFDIWRDGGKVYGVSLVAGIEGYIMDAGVMDGYGEVSIETLLDALLAREGQAVYLAGYDSRLLLKVFLEGTDSIWGMVDWEAGACDFGGELFAKLLEAAKRYGDDGRNSSPALAASIGFTSIFDSYPAYEMEAAGAVAAGVLFDDGWHAAVSSGYTIAVNANSDKKEGAWEFISYLLSGEVQSARQDGSRHSTFAPVNRNAFSAWAEKQKGWLTNGGVPRNKVKWVGGEKVSEAVYYGEEDLTEERIAEYRQILEDARPYPRRTEPIVEIICEEAMYYFDGSKSIEEVAGAVENRVRLYLDEIQKD